MKVVLDKSFLQGTNSKDIADLCLNNDVLMPESLFFELLTTEPKIRAVCFKKVPKIENPLVLVPNVGTIIRYEIQNNKPCSDIREIAINVRYKFNEKLVSTNFTLTEQQRLDLSEWGNDIKSQIEDFKEKSAVVTGWFPKTKGFKPGRDLSPIEEAKSLICQDSNVVKSIYQQIKHKTFPEPDQIHEKWALFKWIQVHILAALDYVGRYGDGNMDAISKKIENEFLDLDYCITALIVGGLASKDNGMIDRFKRIRPNGIVLN